MGYKTILVSLNEPGKVREILRVVGQLAKIFKAHVKGLYVIPAVQLYPSIGYETVPQVFDGNQIFFKDQEQSVSDLFKSELGSQNISFELEVINSQTPSISPTVITQGRCADLIIISATNPEEPTGVEPDFIEQVVLGSGRPVLVLPYQNSSEINLNLAVIGWHGGREAARATFDALPLLREMTIVHVLQANIEKSKALESQASAQNMVSTLQRQGVKAEAKTRSIAGADAGETLLSYAADYEAGLLVMGAYGHSRLREYIFGGATLHILNTLKLPILMSH